MGKTSDGKKIMRVQFTPLNTIYTNVYMIMLLGRNVKAI